MNNLFGLGKIAFDKVGFTNADSSELNKYKLEPNDILFNVRNSYELVGKSGLFDKNDNIYIYNHMLLRLRLNPRDTNAKFLVYYFNSSEFQPILNSIKKGSTSIVAIYQGDLMKLSVPTPPLPEQERIVAYLDTSFAKLDTLIMEQQERLAQLVELKKSILQEAFEGKL